MDIKHVWVFSWCWYSCKRFFWEVWIFLCHTGMSQLSAKKHIVLIHRCQNSFLRRSWFVAGQWNEWLRWWASGLAREPWGDWFPETLSRSHLRHLRLMNAYDMNYKFYSNFRDEWWLYSWWLGSLKSSDQSERVITIPFWRLRLNDDLMGVSDVPGSFWGWSWFQGCKGRAWGLKNGGRHLKKENMTDFWGDISCEDSWTGATKQQLGINNNNNTTTNNNST